MRVLNKQVIEKFSLKHPASRVPLSRWLTAVESATWGSLVDIRQTFNSADIAGDYTVFNIARNNFRLVALVTFVSGQVAIANVLTHAEYDRWKA